MFIKIPDLRYGHRWVTPERLAAERQITTPREEQMDVLARIHTALAEVEHQRPQWHPELEDGPEGYVRWDGVSPEAMVVRFGAPAPSIAPGQPALFPARIGPRQADVLRYVYHHPGCSQNAAMCGGYYSYKGSGYMGAHTLEWRGLLTIDRSDPRRYALTITSEGISALRARAARHGWVTGDPF